MSRFPEVDKFLDTLGLSIDGQPRYRLVWSDDSFEWRKGTFKEFYGSIFLRETSEVRRVPKYAYLSNRWILEKYFPNSHSEELPVYDHYEPLFVFQDKNCNPLPVSLKMIEILVNFDRNHDKKNRSYEDQAKFDKLDKAEFAEILDSIDSSPIASLLHSREAIIRP